MKNILILVTGLCLGLGGCAHQNAGMRFYGVVTSEDPETGAVSQSTKLLASIAGEMPGLKKVTVGSSVVEFDPNVKGTEERPIFDKERKLLAVIRRDILPGFFTAPTIHAQGEANKKAIDAGGAAGTGIALSTMGPPAVMKGGSSIAGALSR